MNKVFILVDWQVDFVDAENGVMGFERAKEIGRASCRERV